MKIEKKILLLGCFIYGLTSLYATNTNHIGSNKLYYGVAYYPEAWPVDNIDTDILRMKELNINVVRMAEFSWSKMEPEEGIYNFNWLRSIIRKLHANGIDVILGTPTAAPPAWLGEKYPEIYLIDEYGRRMTHGERRKCGYTNKTYRELSKKICEKMAQEVGSEPGVIGWQIDNEFALSPDYSEETRQKWVKWLENRYQRIDSLNNKWGLNLWSQNYSNFNQIPMPKPPIWHNPSLIYAWREFTNQQLIEYQDIQIKAIRKYSSAPITHDAMPGQLVDYERLFTNLDFAATNVYHSFEAYDLIHSNYDRLRGMNKGLHWLFETAPNNSGGGDNGSTWFLHQIPGSMKAALWMNYASGGQGAMFWLWRQQWSGHEMPHGAVISAWGKPAANWDEIKELGNELSKSSKMMIENPVKKAEAAIVYSHLAANGLSIEKFANGLKYYTDWSFRFFRPMADNYIFRDVIYPNADISSYKLIFMPLLPYIPQDLKNRLKTWVEAGGTLLIGPMSGYRTKEWSQFTDRQMGDFESWLGITVEAFLPVGTNPRDKEIRFNLKFAPDFDIPNQEARLWALSLSSKEGKTVATYQTGHHAGLPAIMEINRDKGKAVLLGTDPGQLAMGKLLLHYSTEAGISPDAEGDPGIVIVPREGKTKGYALVNISNKYKKFKLKKLSGTATEILSNTKIDCDSEIKLAPYEVKILFK